MLADIAVEPQSAVITPLAQAFALQKVNWKNGGMPAIAAAERQCAAFHVGQRRNRSATDGDDLRGPAEVGVAHRDRSAAMITPGVRLQIRQVGIPRDVYARRQISRPRQKRSNLHLVTLEQHHLDRQIRFFVKVASHTLPDRHDLGIVCNSTYPYYSAHCCPSHWYDQGPKWRAVI